MIDDAELLRGYATSRSESDFAELVRRHVNLVYSAALRQMNGDAHLAQDVTQEVFTDLARKAAAVANHRVLAGWLFTSTRFAAAKAVRGEQRRHARERESQLMHELNRDPAAQLDWTRVRPVLDEVLGELSDADREAILLRFFEGRDFASVGERLHMNDNSARMRVDRALDKLRALLERRGVTSTSAALAAALANQAVMAAPVGLAAVVTGAVLAGVGASATASGAAAGAGAWATLMSMTKLQVGISSALALAGAAGIALQARSNAGLRDEVASLRQQNTAIATLRAENNQLKRAAADVADMRNDDAELRRLTDEAAALKPRMKQVAQAQAAIGETFDISKLDQAPRPKFQARPQYPAALRSAGVGGEVLVDFLVDTNGDVRNARAVRGAIAGGGARTTGGTAAAVVPLPASPRAGKSNLGGEKDSVVQLTPFTVASGAGTDPSPVSSAEASQAIELLAQAAVEAVSQWKFSAGRKGGRDVVTHMQVPMVFSLASKDAAAPPAK